MLRRNDLHNFGKPQSTVVPKAKSLIAFGVGIWLINLVVGVGLLGLVCFVLWHFIHKFW